MGRMIHTYPKLVRRFVRLRRCETAFPRGTPAPLQRLLNGTPRLLLLFRGAVELSLQSRKLSGAFSSPLPRLLACKGPLDEWSVGEYIYIYFKLALWEDSRLSCRSISTGSAIERSKTSNTVFLNLNSGMFWYSRRCAVCPQVGTCSWLET